MHEPRPLEQLVEQIADTAALSEVHVFHRDDETRSCVSLNGVGAHRYVSDPSTEFLFRAWAVDDGPVQLWVPGDPIPPEAFEAAHNANWLVGAHGDHFETANEEHLLGPRHGWPLVPLERHTCTMARALALGLPAKLHFTFDLDILTAVELKSLHAFGIIEPINPIRVFTLTSSPRLRHLMH